MAKIYKFKGKPRSENFIKEINPTSISDYLAEQHPDLPERIIDAMSLAMIYSTYLSMVCEEENYSCQRLFEEPIDFLTSYGKETLH